MLENQQSQLVTGLQELYKLTQNGQGWIGSPLKESSHGAPLTHDILERLGALKQDGHATGEMFEEDLGAMQQRLIANGAGFMARDASSDSDSDAGQSPLFEPLPQKTVSPTRWEVEIPYLKGAYETPGAKGVEGATTSLTRAERRLPLSTVEGSKPMGAALRANGQSYGGSCP